MTAPFFLNTVLYIRDIYTFLYTFWYMSRALTYQVRIEKMRGFFVSFPLQVLVYLQLCKNVSLVFLDGWQEVTNHVCAVTKALSKRPFKYAATLVIVTLTDKENFHQLSISPEVNLVVHRAVREIW